MAEDVYYLDGRSNIVLCILETISEIEEDFLSVVITAPSHNSM